MPGYADQSNADSQRNRMAKVEDSNIQEEGEQDGSVVVGVDEQQVINLSNFCLTLLWLVGSLQC